jgi:hypothetical protein
MQAMAMALGCVCVCVCGERRFDPLQLEVKRIDREGSAIAAVRQDGHVYGLLPCHIVIADGAIIASKPSMLVPIPPPTATADTTTANTSIHPSIH